MRARAPKIARGVSRRAPLVGKKKRKKEKKKKRKIIEMRPYF